MLMEIQIQIQKNSKVMTWAQTSAGCSWKSCSASTRKRWRSTRANCQASTASAWRIWRQSWWITRSRYSAFACSTSTPTMRSTTCSATTCKCRAISCDARSAKCLLKRFTAIMSELKRWVSPTMSSLLFVLFSSHYPVCSCLSSLFHITSLI